MTKKILLIVIIVLTGCGQNQLIMSCEGLLSISNQSGLTNSVPNKTTITLSVQSEGNSLTKAIDSLSIDGKKYQICQQDSKEVKFLDDCSKAGPIPGVGNDGSNNFTNNFSYDKTINTLTMITIYRSGYMFVSDKTYSLKCEPR
jgi:hypothetical protein